MDDYSRFTWVKFLRSKDETPEFVINFLKQIQVGLNKTVRYIRTDNGTEFVNQVMSKYYEGVGIFHQKSVSRTPKKNGVVERRNRTLVGAARTMLIFLKVPMFLWAAAIATALFGALCYPTNDSEDLGKFQANADVGIFIGYAPSRKGPEPMSMTPGQFSSGLIPNQVHATNYVLPTDTSATVTVNTHVVPPDTSVSTTFAQDAPSTSFAPSSSGVMIIDLKWNYKVKLGEYGDVLKNKSR
ncbi:retrovirus-related pol polyprotein from transposon TNT 1-94, partial [Tanacetum coccineum]